MCEDPDLPLLRRPCFQTPFPGAAGRPRSLGRPCDRRGGVKGGPSCHNHAGPLLSRLQGPPLPLHPTVQCKGLCTCRLCTPSQRQEHPLSVGLRLFDYEAFICISGREGSGVLAAVENTTGGLKQQKQILSCLQPEAWHPGVGGARPPLRAPGQVPPAPPSPWAPAPLSSAGLAAASLGPLLGPHTESPTTLSSPLPQDTGH